MTIKLNVGFNKARSGRDSLMAKQKCITSHCCIFTIMLDLWKYFSALEGEIIDILNYYLLLYVRLCNVVIPPNYYTNIRRSQ